MKTNDRTSHLLRVGELIEPLLNISTQPDRNNLLRAFFRAEDRPEARRPERINRTAVKAKPRRKTPIIPLYTHFNQPISNL